MYVCRANYSLKVIVDECSDSEVIKRRRERFDDDGKATLTILNNNNDNRLTIIIHVYCNFY